MNVLSNKTPSLQSYGQFRERFSLQFTDALDALCTRAGLKGNHALVKEHIEYVKTLAKDGKRFRPFMAYHSYALSGGQDAYTDVFIALELLHTFALIHDDIMDRAPLRHTVETAHVHFMNVYKKHHDTDPEHRGISQGILLGDIVLLWSMEYFMRGIRGLNNEVYTEAYRAYHILVEEVIVGQMVDITLASKKECTMKEVLDKNMLKSGKYTFVWPLQIGAILGTADEKRKKFLWNVGSILGTIFQTQDDVLDYLNSSGKAWCGDIEEGQQTMISAYMCEHASQAHKRAFMSYLGRTLFLKEKEDVCTLLHESGAFQFAQTIISDSFTTLEQMLSEEGEYEQWKEILLFLRTRTV